MPRTCAQRSAWWWPLALALFALSAFAAIMMGAGTAHADSGDPSPTGETRSEKTSEKSPAKTSDKAPEKTPEKTSDETSDKAPDETSEESDTPTTEPPDRPADGPGKSSTVRDTDTAEEKSKPSEEESPSSEEPRLARRSNVLDLTPRLAAREPEPVEANDDVVQQANAVAPTAIRPTLRPTVEQLVRQGIGLASDAGIIGASLVNNIALLAASTIGPQPFWGVPYAVAIGVADSAARVSKAFAGTPLDAVSEGPFKVNYGVLDVLSFFTPSKVPAGANDPSITVTAEHPLPVILVNGTVETQSLNWSVGAPVLANAGYKVYTFNYGNITPYASSPIQSTADIRLSAIELSDEIDRVLAETGAAKVILVGHSQGGGILPAYYLNEMGGADKVSQLIGLAPSNHGTTFNGLVALQYVPILGPLLFAVTDILGPALGQQVVTSPFQQVVYGDGDTQDGVLYTTIASTHDEVVTPYTQQALDGPNVTNIVLQDVYPGLPTGHVGVAFSSQAWASVLAALAANAEANPTGLEELAAA